MPSEKKFSLLRNILRALGLSQEAADDVVNWILDLLAGEGKSGSPQAAQFPYIMRESFLTPAELNFFRVLQEAVGNHMHVCAKVALGDIFSVKSKDQSQFRIYTNKIDRKHVDFLLCDPQSMRPVVGVELDDRSHQREDRRARDAFVDEVFRAAGLPLLHIAVRRSYRPEDLAAQFSPYLSGLPGSAPAVEPLPPSSAPGQPRCPKCGSMMILRTAKTGAKAGSHFWGCSNFPTCRGIFQYEASE